MRKQVVEGKSIDRPLTALEILPKRPIATSDQAGALIMAVVIFPSIAGGAGFLIMPDHEMGFRIIPAAMGTFLFVRRAIGIE